MEYGTMLIALMVLPLICSLVMAALPSKSMPKVVYESIHVISVAAVLVLGVFLVFQEFTSGEVIMALGQWFRLDALSAVFVALISVIGGLVGIFAIPYIAHDVEEGTMNMGQVKSFYAFFSLFLFTMLLAALSNNIIMMWISVEATTLATVFLVGAYRTKTALEAAWKYVIVCAAGVAFGLYGVLLIYANAADIMADPTQAVFWTAILPIAGELDPTLVAIAFTFTVVGFGTKAGLFPMHTWLPDAHSEAPSPVSALLSGVLLKCAILVIIRFYVLTVTAIGTTYPRIILVTLGGLSVVIAAFSIFRQDDLKRKLAYSSSENIGVVALALGFGGPIGIAAALLHCIFHGLTKALMFCLSGNVLMRYHTRSLEKITGMLEVMPISAVLIVFGFFALSGFPPFAMFISEIGMVMAGWNSGLVAIVIIVVLALTVVVAAFAIAAVKAAFGRAPEGMEKRDLPVMALVPEIILALAIIWFGICLPQPILTGVDDATSIVMQEEVDPLQTGSLLSGIASAIQANE